MGAFFISNSESCLESEESWVGAVDVSKLEVMEDEGEASSASGRVEMSGEGDVCENSSREDSKLAEDTSIEQQGDASVEKLTEPEVATSHVLQSPFFVLSFFPIQSARRILLEFSSLANPGRGFGGGGGVYLEWRAKSICFCNYR